MAIDRSWNDAAPETYLMLSVRELLYLDACVNVADGEGEQANNYGVDQGALIAKIQRRIDEIK